MPRRTRPKSTRRSEHWLRLTVNDHSDLLNNEIIRTFKWDTNTCINWLSPVKEDAYAEYYDESFLQRLGVTALQEPLSNFWPSSGPRWDGLGKTNCGKLILVEAKAYIEEAIDFRSRAKGKSLEFIQSSLKKSEVAFGVNKNASWASPFYQYSNRLAHLHFLAGLNKMDAYLVFLYFANAPDVEKPCSIEEWRGAIRLIKKCLGLNHHRYLKKVADVVLDVKDISFNQ